MKNLYNIIFMAGAGLLLLGAVLQITRWDFAPFMYTVGAVMFGYVQVMGNRYDGKNFIVKRLRSSKSLVPLRWFCGSTDVYDEP